MICETTIVKMITTLTILFKKVSIVRTETVNGYIKLTFQYNKNKNDYKVVVLDRFKMGEQTYFAVNRILNISCFDNSLLKGEVI